MLQYSIIRIEEPIHTILRTALLAPVQLPTRDPLGHTLFPADVCEVVDS